MICNQQYCADSSTVASQTVECMLSTPSHHQMSLSNNNNNGQSQDKRNAKVRAASQSKQKPDVHFCLFCCFLECIAQFVCEMKNYFGLYWRPVPCQFHVTDITSENMFCEVASFLHKNVCVHTRTYMLTY